MNSERDRPTRRAALVTISGVAAGLGIPIHLPSATTTAPELPPGLYLPSSGHLGHALMSSSRFHSIPLGSPTDYVRPPNGPFAPLFFSALEFRVVCRLAELLLGEPTLEADSAAQEVAEWIDLRAASAAEVRTAARNLDPLYRALAVAYFGPEKVTRLETEHPEKVCREGLVWLSEAARARNSNGFLSLSEGQQIAVLLSISDERSDRNTENAGTRFFTFLKSETVRGYYTSQGGLKELDFKGNAFYARSPGCDSKLRQKT